MAGSSSSSAVTSMSAPPNRSILNSFALLARVLTYKRSDVVKRGVKQEKQEPQRKKKSFLKRNQV
jgi:hypothetical protein